MAFNNRRSWRLKFIDIDSSFSINETVSAINGYIAARAPKGTQRGTYFTPGNAQGIDALMGVGSAHWPDLLEAKAFNAEYPLYISAPPGSSAAYPSRLGGFYITNRGIYNFYGVTDLIELEDNSGNAFLTAVQPGEEVFFDADFEGSETKITIGAPDFASGTDWTSDDGIVRLVHTEDEYYLTLEKNRRLNVSAIEHMPMRNGLVPLASDIMTFWGDNDNDSQWSFQGQSATLRNFGFTFNPQDVDRNALRAWLGNTIFDYFSPTEGSSISDITEFHTLLRNGWLAIDGGRDVLSIPFRLQDIITLLVNIQDETYCYFAQKSCTEIPTTIRISDIGYDKYRYDTMFPYAPTDPASFAANGMFSIEATLTDELRAELKEHTHVALYNVARPQDGVIAIGELVEENGIIQYRNVTAQFVTTFFACSRHLVSFNEHVFHKIFQVISATEIRHLITEEESIALHGPINGPMNYEAGFAAGLSAPRNVNFNQISLSCSEEVHPGRTTSGGEFTGSLDENGRNTFGVENFWPLMLPDDAVSFIVVRVLRKFGDNINDHDETGFWNHKRIIDPFDIDGDGNTPRERTFQIVGDRYVTLINLMNQMELRTGGIWRDEYYEIIRDALHEGLLPEYDDVYIYMEPTGQEIFKSDLLALSNIGDKLAAVISPKILQPNARGVFTDAMAQRTIVNSRGSQSSNALYAGEFEYYDPVARKRYWCQPIGDVGKNIARIIEFKLGGWAPAWTNISGNLGGQLGRSVIRSRYQFEDEATRTLDTRGINPIVFNSENGVMIVSHRTTQDATNMSDWCFLGHSLSFQLCKREIRNDVMIPQIMKPINEYWMGIRQMQVDGILSRRTSGTSPIWAMAVCDIMGQNTPHTKAQRNFVIRATVRVNVFSESVTLILENVHQTM
jgi:hypothetical protein